MHDIQVIEVHTFKDIKTKLIESAIEMIEENCPYYHNDLDQIYEDAAFVKSLDESTNLDEIIKIYQKDNRNILDVVYNTFELKINDVSKLANMDLKEAEEIYLELCKEHKLIKEDDSNLKNEIMRLNKIIDNLKLYFTSGNSIPVERATILSKDFWKIVNGISINQD